MLFNDSQRLDIDFGQSTNGDFFEYLQKMSVLVYHKETSYQYDQIRNMTSLNLENCAMSERYFSYLNSLHKLEYKMNKGSFVQRYLDTDVTKEGNMKLIGYSKNATTSYEELRLRGNQLTNKTFYALTHCATFNSLRILDLRCNNITSIHSLNLNKFEVGLPNLKEFYLDIEPTPAATKEDLNIEYFFTGYPGIFLNLGKFYPN
jgi:Leucine-rich repeat (LRR) protein